MVFESWDAGGRESYLYTQDRSIAKELRKEFGCGMVYFRNEAPFGWQFLVPTRILPLLRKKFVALGEEDFEIVETSVTEKMSIEFKELRAA